MTWRMLRCWQKLWYVMVVNRYGWRPAELTFMVFFGGVGVRIWCFTSQGSNNTCVNYLWCLSHLHGLSLSAAWLLPAFNQLQIVLFQMGAESRRSALQGPCVTGVVGKRRTPLAQHMGTILQTVTPRTFQIPPLHCDPCPSACRGGVVDNTRTLLRSIPTPHALLTDVLL